MPETKPNITPAEPVKQKTPRGAKWAIVLLSLLCVLLLAALLEVAFLPSLIERDVNSLLQKMAGDGVEFRIKTFSLTSAEVACKIKDTSRNGRPLNVGSIGSLSIRYSPFTLLRDRAVESIEIENCNVVADYSDGSVSIPAWELFKDKFQTSEKKEKDDSAPADDLNAVIPVKVGRFSLSGSLTAVARGEDSVDTLHVPYAVTVRPDAELGWNKLGCSLMIHFATNGIRCKATYLHREKKVELDLDDFSLATSSLPGTIRSSLPRGLRVGVSLNAKAAIALDSLNVDEMDRSTFELNGNLTLGYRMPQGLRIDSAAPFSLKTVPRIIPTVKPMNPPKTENLLVFTLGAIRGEYDAIPFELDKFEATASLQKKTLQGGFQFTVADSEPAEFGFGGSLDDEATSFELKLENTPQLKANYKGADANIRLGSFLAGYTLKEGRTHASANFNISPRIGFDGGTFSPELKGLTAAFEPENIQGTFSYDKGASEGDHGWLEAECKIWNGEHKVDYNGMSISLKPNRIDVGVMMAEDDTGKTQGATLELLGGEIAFEQPGVKATFHPESFRAGYTTPVGRMNKLYAELKGGKFAAELEGMTCEAETVAFNAESNDGKAYRADAKIGDFEFKQLAAGLTYAATEFGLNAEFADNAVSGTLACPDSKLAMPQMKVLAKDLTWELPFEFALAKDEPTEATETPSQPPKTGKIVLGEVVFDGIRTASLDGTILWDDPAKTFRLKTDAKLFSILGEIRADVALGAAGVEVECGLTIPEQQADLSKDLQVFFPQFEEISCTGKLSADAVYKILPKTTTGSAKVSISGADVLIPDKKCEIRGVGLGFEIPEIAVMKSAPGQTLTFQSVKYDKIETGAGKFAFRMEAPDTWQIENALLDWCGGHIRLGGVTYRPGQTTTEAVLYCDRLNLPVFLTQIGLGEISGSGAINGTIPIVITQKEGQALPDNVYFEDAFLFSTPGEDGVIQGDIDEAILSSEGGVEMELAKDALKDFTYSWVRMSMLSTGEDKQDLKLSLQLDGRPNRALYYAFDENTASFVKSNTPCIFQGIRLDTNVNVESGKALELVDYVKQIFSRGD